MPTSATGRGGSGGERLTGEWSLGRCLMSPRRTLLTTTACVAGYSLLQWLGRTYGSTRGERRRLLPGDELCADPQIVTTHAVTIDAPPEHVWPWLVQIGWGRGQWYTARWVAGCCSRTTARVPTSSCPKWQRPPEAGCAFVVDDLNPPRHLVLHSTEHLPPGWAERFGAGIDWTWAFVLDPLVGGRTRFLFRTRVRLRPWWVAVFYWIVMVPADFIMSRQMLRGIKERAERTTAADLLRLAAGSPVPGPRGSDRETTSSARRDGAGLAP